MAFTARPAICTSHKIMMQHSNRYSASGAMPSAHGARRPSGAAEHQGAGVDSSAPAVPADHGPHGQLARGAVPPAGVKSSYTSATVSDRCTKSGAERCAGKDVLWRMCSIQDRAASG